ncbi:MULTISPECIES: hypothetical protein [unclassified Pseudomonas]|uniref:hypothetical protein n=1 Tax=Pseudomonas TaxID=286 RepID=UPI000837F682|nr:MULTISPECIES: hypothetical protein [unclassified Pseudomonas]QIH09272.1 hypothetical protein ATY02_22465 [Pseudomonas sp. BIOMIG1BAC]
MAQVIIEFTGSWRGYGKGEVAGFEEDVAQSLIDGGRAVAYEGGKGGKKGKSRAPAPGGEQSGTTPQPGAESGPAPDTDTPDDEAKP